MSDTQAIHKASWFRTIAGKGKWYLISSATTKGLGIILLPIYTRYLSPSDYGILNTLNSIAQLLPIFISLYLDAAFGRFYHTMKIDPRQLRRLFSTSYWFVLLNGTIVLALALFSLPLWGKVLEVPIALYALALVPMIFVQISQLGLVFLRQSLEARKTTFLDVSSAVLIAAITVPLLVGLRLGVSAKLIGTAVSAVYSFIFYTVYLWQKGILGLEFDLKMLKLCLAFSLPLLPNILGGWIAGLSDRLVLSTYVNTAATGIYSLSVNLASLLYIIQDAITQVSSPISMSGLVHDREVTKHKISVLSLALWTVMLMADAGMMLFSREAIMILATHKYVEAASIVGYIGLTYVFASQYRIFSDIIAYHRKTWAISAAGILMAAVGFGMNLLLVPRFGYFASVAAIITSTMVYTIWIYCWAQKYDRIKMYWVRMVTIMAIFAITIFVGSKLVVIDVTTIIVKIIIYAVSIGVSWAIIRKKIFFNSSHMSDHTQNENV